jgi:hypothetical protein
MAMSVAMTVRMKDGNEIGDDCEGENVNKSGDDGEDEGLAMRVAMKVKVEDDNGCCDDGEG